LQREFYAPGAETARGSTLLHIACEMVQPDLLRHLVGYVRRPADTGDNAPFIDMNKRDADPI
jgi:hypothetical protein